jgi:hypothetical protein
MTVTSQAIIEVARFLAGSPTPEEIIAFHPSEEATERIYELIEAEKDGSISIEEQKELDRGVHFEYMIRLVKAEARKRLAQKAS